MFNWVMYPVLFAAGASVPIEGLWAMEAGPFILTPSKLSTGVLLILVCVRLILAPQRPPRSIKTPWIVGFYGVLALSTFHALSQGTSGLEMIGRWQNLIALLLFYFLVPLVIHTRRDLHVLYWSLLAGGLFASISATLGVGSTVAYDWERSAGFGGRANQTAANLLMALPLAYALFVDARGRFRQALLLAAMGMLAFGVVLTLSRSGFVASVAMGLLWAARFGRSTNVRLLIPIGAVIGVVLMFAPASYFKRIAGLGNEAYESRNDRNSDSFRMQQYRLGLSAVASNPLLGAGLGRFPRWAHARDATYPTRVPVHNAELEIASETGLLGLIPFLAMLILTWRELSQISRGPRSPTLRDDPELKAIGFSAVCAQTGFLGFLVVAQFQPFGWEKSLYLAFALGTTLAALSRKRIAVLERQASPLAAASGSEARAHGPVSPWVAPSAR